MSIRHPLWETLHAARQAYNKELGDLAVKLRIWAGELQYLEQGKALPSYRPYKDAQEAWMDGGYPLLATPGCFAHPGVKDNADDPTFLS